METVVIGHTADKLTPVLPSLCPWPAERYSRKYTHTPEDLGLSLAGR